MKIMKFVHRKSGAIYDLVYITVNQTNGHEGQLYAVYRPYHARPEELMSTMELNEFYENFRIMKGEGVGYSNHETQRNGVQGIAGRVCTAFKT